MSAAERDEALEFLSQQVRLCRDALVIEQKESDELAAENETLRAALERIAQYEWKLLSESASTVGAMKKIASDALARGGDAA